MRVVVSLMTIGTLAYAANSDVADAAKKDERATVEKLIAAHADVNAPQIDGTSALHWAAYVDDLELAKKLLDAGAKPGATNRYGMTVLAQACINGDARMIELLLAHGADANQTSPGAETPLMTRHGREKPMQCMHCSRKARPLTRRKYTGRPRSSGQPPRAMSRLRES